MRRARFVLFVYLTCLGVQYALNPFVPSPQGVQQSQLKSALYPPLTAIGSESLSKRSRLPAAIPLKSSSTFLPSLSTSKSNFTGEEIHRDPFGLIVQADGDGGDTAQRTGMFYYIHHDPNGFTQALDRLEIKPGIYVRHPFQPGFRSDPRRFSRDQQRPLIIALGKYRMTERLERLAWQHILRLGKYQNLDFIGPVGVGEYIRAFDNKLFYPVLVVTDASLFIGSLQLIASASLNPDEVDDNNHVMSLLQAQDVMSTPFSWLAIKTYRWLRPPNLGNSALGKPDPVQGALAWYHRSESGGNPYLGEALFNALNQNQPQK